MENAKMACLGFETGTTGWKVQKNPLSYDGPKMDI